MLLELADGGLIALPAIDVVDEPAVDDETGIAGVNADDRDAVIYDLSGRRLEKAQKGVNIIISDDTVNGGDALTKDKSWDIWGDSE